MKTEPGTAIPVYEAPFTPMTGQNHQSYTLGTAAVSVYVPTNARSILIQSVTQNSRYVLDGSTPTATRGFQLLAGDPPILIPITKNTKLVVIREAAGAILEYQFGE